MSLATFRGGIHLYEGKELSMEKPIETLLPEGELVYPISQHIGAPAAVIVKVGDTVLAGQKLAEAGGFVSAPVISSVSGRVVKIEPRVTAAGAMVESVIVENDGEYKTIDGYGREADYQAMTKEEILAKIRDAGIVGLGGAGFPVHVKLAPKEPDKIDRIIINAAECEPYITSDYRLMMEQGEKLVEGLKIELSLFEHATGIIGIEDNKPEAIAHLTELTRGEDRIKVVPLQTKYPQGGERTLIYAVTGRKINSSMLPADVGCIVTNTATAIAIADAVARNMPLLERVVTISGDAVKRTANFRVRTGTMYRELIEAAGGFTEKPAKLISGGPMMGMALFTLDVPVVKTSSSVLAMSKDQVAEYEPSNCIHCGTCVDVCPGFVVPQMLYKAASRGDIETFEKLNGMECCECGCCTYSCPAKLPLTQTFRQARRAVMAERKKKA